MPSHKHARRLSAATQQRRASLRRAFGIAVALNEGGAYDWVDFQQRLADEIAAAPSDTEGTVYYERWLNSLESLLLDYGLVTQTELDARTAAYKSGDIDDD
ncbi:MAG: nitrile hydratase accessory protein [Chloroflexi bacterium]|nr:nitrile hydratase accessory protein [Chloroflexota bacterium]